MINRNLFLKNFQINYFDYKQNSLNYLLQNYSKIGLEETIIEYKDEDYILAIRSDIRQTYFQAIETVFEIYFALLPDKNGTFSENIIEKITLSDLPYSKISEISQNINTLDILGNEINFSDGTKVSLGEYIFYFGLCRNEKYKQNIQESINAIKYTLNIIAKDFSDRKEYNSYKHGLRILPALRKVSVFEPETMKEQFSWDLKGSVTFFSYNKKTEETIYTTKVFDTERDLRMTSICSYLIWNMIKLREVAFNKDEKDKNYSIAIPFYNKDFIDEAKKTNVKIQDLKFSITQEK